MNENTLKRALDGPPEDPLEGISIRLKSYQEQSYHNRLNL